MNMFRKLLPLFLVFSASAYAVQPVIEAGDITSSNNESAETAAAVSHPAYVSGDLLIMSYGGDDDISTDSLTAPTAGPNGETLILSSVGSGGSTSSGPTQGIIAWVGDATVGASTLTWTRGDSEEWAGRTVKVPAGEFDATTPLATVSGYDGATVGASATIATPSWTIGASDGGGTVVVFIVTDVDPIDATPPSGWGAPLANTDHGAIASAVAIRTAATSNSETIASVDYDLVSPDTDTSSTIAVVVRPPAAASSSAVQRRRHE